MITRSATNAGEFAGWLKQQLLEKTMPVYMQAGWTSRVDTSIEEFVLVFAPVPSACPHHGVANLQQLILDWHQQVFVHAFSHDSPWICLQITRFPTVGIKSTCDVIEWYRRVPLRVPIFHDARGLAVEWRDFVVTAGVTHVGSTPTAHHHKCIMWHSGTALEVTIFVPQCLQALIQRSIALYISFGLCLPA